jgi:hypothetical protein
LRLRQRLRQPTWHVVCAWSRPSRSVADDGLGCNVNLLGKQLAGAVKLTRRLPSEMLESNRFRVSISPAGQRWPIVNLKQFVLQQLPFHIPILLVYLVGVIISLSKLRRMPQPAGLALIGCGMALLTNLGSLSWHAYLISNSSGSSGWSPFSYELVSTFVNIMRALLQMISMSLILAAVFTGRSTPPVLSFRDMS